MWQSVHKRVALLMVKVERIRISLCFHFRMLKSALINMHTHGHGHGDIPDTWELGVALVILKVTAMDNTTNIDSEGKGDTLQYGQ